MNCVKCGTAIPEGSLYCPKCGNAVQMVPDYTSLENILAEEVNECLGPDPAKTAYHPERQRRYDATGRYFEDRVHTMNLKDRSRYPDADYNDRYSDIDYRDRYSDDRTRVMNSQDRDRYSDSDYRDKYIDDRTRLMNTQDHYRYSDENYRDRYTDQLYRDRNTGSISSDRYSDSSYRERSTETSYRNRNTGSVSRDRYADSSYRDRNSGTSYGGRNTSNMYHDRNELEREREEQERYEREKKAREQRRLEEQKKKKTRILIIGIAAAVVVLLVVIIVISKAGSSYNKQLKKADKYYASEDYTDALEAYTAAASLKPDDALAYIGLGNAYVGTGDTDSAVAAYKTAISVDESCSDAYIALSELYISLDNYSAVTNLFADVTDKSVLKDCSDYIAEVPEITPDGGEYSDTVTVTIKASSGVIRYTMDGTLPDSNSPEYVEPIILNDTNNYSIRAITINDKGISSVDACVEYILNIPSPDGPSVTPSAGTYSEPQQITVTAPSDSKVYYTLDGSTPDENSTLYTGPVDMPEGQSTFSCIAINDKGKSSSVIRRQYNRLNLDSGTE